MLNTLRRELRIALSKRAQPIWFRFAKWAIIIAFTVFFYHSPYFWTGMAAFLLVGLAIHFVYRRHNHGWTRPWGGWTDVEAGK
jgi:hypothetical protein